MVVQAAVEGSSKQQHLAEDEPCFAVLVAWDAAADIQWSAHNSSKKQLPSTSCRHLTEHAKQHAISRSDGAVSCLSTQFVNTVCQHICTCHLNRVLIEEGVPACSTPTILLVGDAGSAEGVGGRRGAEKGSGT